jgi:hypothetical protein
MKTKMIALALLIFVTIPAFCQNPKFNGEWKINMQKSVVPADQLYLSKISLQFKGDSLLTKRYYQSPDGQEYPFDENFSLDGKEAKIFIYDMPRTAKALKNPDGSIVIETKTTFNNGSGEDNLTAKENWKVDNEGKLIMDFTNQMSGQEFKGIFYYDKSL